MDLDALLALKPSLVLVDELAHSNAPGSRHPKRYQDVEELLNTGINVYTTLNVQHIESRIDLIHQITGVVVRETVPDSILDSADQIELIDIPPQDLLKRLKEGKVYLGEGRAERAAQNFFKEEHLTALRELALRYTAQKVDEELRSHMNIKKIVGPWNINERILVAISHSPYSAQLIRAARRMAANLEAPWIALYVDTGIDLKLQDQDTLAKNLNLARELGAELVTTRDSSLLRAIKRVCENRNVTQVVIGRPDKRFIKDIISSGTLLDQLVRETNDIEIHVMRQERKPQYKGFYLHWPKLRSGFHIYWNTLWFMIGVTFIGFVLSDYIGYRAISYIYLIGVLIVASITSPGPILFAAACSAAAWNFFFIPPKYTFIITSPEDIMMCLMYFGVASVAGMLTARIRRQETDLEQREFRANVLYELGKEFGESKNAREIASAASRCIEKLFSTETAIVLADDNKILSTTPVNFFSRPLDDKDIAVATWCFTHSRKAGWKTDTLASAKCLCFPLAGRTGTIGVVVLYPMQTKSMTPEQENLFATITNQLALALERENFELKARHTHLLEQAEKLHQTILNSVSHELRTPLTSIIGAATALQDKITGENPATRQTLTEELVNASERLNHVVENLLDMSRIEGGVLAIKEETFGLNDLIDVTVKTVSRSLKHHKLDLTFSKEEIFVRGDYRLLQHALANLIINSSYYSPSGSTIKISTSRPGENAMIQVIDEGKGIPDEALVKVFDKFYRVPGSPSGGVGLGLSIVKSIVDAHKGRVKVENRTDRQGTVATIYLAAVDLPISVAGDFSEH